MCLQEDKQTVRQTDRGNEQTGKEPDRPNWRLKLHVLFAYGIHWATGTMIPLSSYNKIDLHCTLKYA